MRLRSATVALLALALSWAASDACARSRERISGAYSVDGLGLGEPVVPDSWAYKRYKCARSEQYAEAVFCKFKEVKDGAVQSTTILHRLDNTAIYINRDISPAFFDIAGVEDEIGRLSKRFGKPRQILQSTRGIIAIWGGIELRSVSPAAASVLARGKSPKLGFLVDFLDNFEDSARSGSPVYQLEGGPGFVWAASFKSGAHKSSLRFFAADPAQMRRLPSPYDAPPSDEATPPAAPGPGGSATQVQMNLDGGVYVVPVRFNEAITLNAVVDSGATDVSVPADVVMTLVRTGTITDDDFLGEQTYRLADGSQVPSQRFRLRSLKVGDIAIENVEASIADVKATILLGQSFLGRFHSWSVDNNRHLLILH